MLYSYLLYIFFSSFNNERITVSVEIDNITGFHNFSVGFPRAQENCWKNPKTF